MGPELMTAFAAIGWQELTHMNTWQSWEWGSPTVSNT